MRIDIPPPPLEEPECMALPVDEVHTIPAANSPKTPPKPRVSIAAEVHDLLTWAMADASSCKPEHSPIGKVATVEAVASPPQKSEASPQLVDTFSQASMEEAETSLEGLPVNMSPLSLPPTAAEVLVHQWTLWNFEPMPTEPLPTTCSTSRGPQTSRDKSDLGTRGTVASE